METNNKLREALNDIIDKIDKWRTDGSMEHWQYSQLSDIADAALAEPVKNYEVGTAEEQAPRFDCFCQIEKGNCGDCPLWVSGTVGHNCELRWAQMPYIEKEGVSR